MAGRIYNIPAESAERPCLVWLRDRQLACAIRPSHNKDIQVLKNGGIEPSRPTLAPLTGEWRDVLLLERRNVRAVSEYVRRGPPHASKRSDREGRSGFYAALKLCHSILPHLINSSIFLPVSRHFVAQPCGCKTLLLLIKITKRRDVF